jgi:hypothetical protein
MPIEIRELVIRATVDPQSTGQGAGNCGAGAGPQRGKGGAPSGAAGAGGAGGANPDMVQSCVREVMRILEEKQGR